MHDFLLDLRGAERVFAAICEAWPDADVFTAVYDEDGTEGRFADRRPQTSFLQRLHPTARTFRPLLPFYPHAIESFDLRSYDAVVSSSSAWAHGVLVDPGAVHVCYCHNPFRYAWTEREATLRARHPLTRLPLRVLLNRWRQWDWIAAQRVDRYVANSHLTAARVRRYFGREATVLYPPVETGRFATAPVAGGPYMVLAELMAHKRIDVAVRAFNALRLPLVVVGDGPELRRLRRLAGPTIAFAGRVSDERVADLLARCARARGDGDRGVRDRGRRGPRGRAAGDRARAGRRQRERHRGRHRDVLRALRARGAGGGGAGVRSARDRSPRLPRRGRALRRRAVPRRAPADRRRGDERRPRAAAGGTVATAALRGCRAGV